MSNDYLLQCKMAHFEKYVPLAFYLSVEEYVSTILIPVVRRVGSYGPVSAQFISRSLTATLGLDYILDNGTVMFDHGQNTSYINVTILDDLDR